MNSALAEIRLCHFVRHKIILRRMPAEMFLGICQVVMHYDTIHRTDFKLVFKSALFQNEINNAFNGISARIGRWKPPEKRERFRDGHPSETILASTRFLWATTVDTEVSVLPTAPPALLLPGFDSHSSSSIDKFGRKFRRLGSKIEQSFTRQIQAKPSIICVFQVINPYIEK